MWGQPRPAAHLHLLEHRVVLNPREQHPHGVRPVVEEGDAGTIQVAGQLVNVSLQLCKGCGQTRYTRQVPHWPPGPTTQGWAQTLALLFTGWVTLRKLLYLLVSQLN